MKRAALSAALSAAVGFALATAPFQSGAAESPSPPLELQLVLPPTHVLPSLGLSEGAALRLGGERNRVLLFDARLPAIRRAAPYASDLETAVLRFRMIEDVTLPDGVNVELHALAQPATATLVVPAPDPILALPAKDCIRGVWFELKLTSTELAPFLDGVQPYHGFLLRLDGPAPLPELTFVGLGYASISYAPRLTLRLRRRANERLFDWPVKPRDGTGARLRNGRLMYGEQRLRLWGVAPASTRHPERLERIAGLGFNAVRVPGGGAFYTRESALAGVAAMTTEMDDFDRYMAAVRANGMWAVCAALHSNVGGFDAFRDEWTSRQSWLYEHGKGAADWEEWSEGLRHKHAAEKFYWIIDERFMAARKRHAQLFLMRVNRHTGQRYADSEAIAMFETLSDNGFVRHLAEWGVEGWPRYFREQLRQRWQRWLTDKYGNDAALERAWGWLGANESLANNTIRFVPVAAPASGETSPRSSDTIAFLVQTFVSAQREFIEHCRAQISPDSPLARVPFLGDAQYVPDLAWLYANSHADALGFGLYVRDDDGGGGRPPNSLRWLLSQQVRDRGFAVLDLGVLRPNPSRAAVPLYAALLGARQDWDAVFFSFFGDGALVDAARDVDESCLVTAIPYGEGSVNLLFDADPALCAAMAAGGRIFLNDLIPPSDQPALAEVRTATAFDARRSGGPAIGGLALRRGIEVAFHDQLADEVLVDGAPLAAVESQNDEGVAVSGPLTWDGANSRTIVDSPRVKALIGQPGPHRFMDGFEVVAPLSDFAVWALISDDGRPLVESERALIFSIVDARNAPPESDPFLSLQTALQLPPQVIDPRSVPVHSEPAPFVLRFPWRLDYRYRGFDFARRNLYAISAAGADVLPHDGRETFVGIIEMRREADVDNIESETEKDTHVDGEEGKP